jgi:hypothetical protein
MIVDVDILHRCRGKSRDKLIALLSEGYDTVILVSICSHWQNPEMLEQKLKPRLRFQLMYAGVCPLQVVEEKHALSRVTLDKVM